MSCVIILLVILSISFVYSSDEFLTIWTPNVINSGQEFNIPFVTSEIHQRTEILVQICNLYATMALASEKLQYIEFDPISQRTISNSTQIHVTLYREENNLPLPRQMCMSQTINDVKTIHQKFNTFIQTDKPIYLPGDDVKFQIIIVDNSLMPYHVQNIQINLVDPKGRVIQKIDDKFYGIYEGSFHLSDKTTLGFWRIKVVVNKKHQWVIAKKFGVTKLKLSKFAAYINIKKDYHIKKSTTQFSIYAQNLIGNFVHGDAQLTINCITNNQEVISKTFSNITGITNANFKIAEELKANSTTKLEYEATVVFKEAESGIESSNTAKFIVYTNFNYKIKAQHPRFFLSGLPFDIKISIIQWNEKLIKSSSDLVDISLDCELQDGTVEKIMMHEKLRKGVALFSEIIPQHTEKLNITVRFINIFYEQSISKGTIGVNKLAVDYSPKLPNYNDHVNVYVKAKSEIDQLIIRITSRDGYSKNMQIYCFFRTICKFDFVLYRSQMPETKVLVYHVVNLTNISQGEVTIISKELGKNFLDIKMPESIKSQKNVEIEVATKPKSTVYLLGYDKRLTKYIRGNENLMDDIIRDLANYDVANRITIFDMKQSNWHECSNEELQNIQKGRRLWMPHYWGYPAVEIEDEVACFDDEKPEETQKLEDFDPIELSEITENFRHVWIFQSFEVPEGKLIKSIDIPVSMTNLIVSSFSVNKNDGIAIGETKELIVENEFYIKTFMPKKIKFGEILQADIMIHNYASPERDIDVTVKIQLWSKNSNIRLHESECSSTSNETKITKTIKIPHKNAQKISFFIQTLADRTSFSNSINVRISAVATDKFYNEYKDTKGIKIKVEPLGAETYEMISKIYELNPRKEELIDFLEQEVSSKDEFKRYYVDIAGDFLTENVRSEAFLYSMYPSYSLDQQIYILKEEINKLRYHKMKNMNVNTSRISEIYQTILSQRAESWNYKNTSGYTALFIDTIASAMEIGALPEDIEMIEKELNVLKALQHENGSFDNFGNILEVKGDTNSVHYFQTAFILIPFLKFRGFVTKNYDDIIEKGFRFMNENTNMELLDREALSVAAYAYALNGSKNQTLEILNEIEKISNQIDKYHKCYKQSASESSCNLRLTAYATLAQLTIDKASNVKHCIIYLTTQHNLRNYHRTNFNYAISVEAISKYLCTNSVNKLTDFNVKFSSERNLETNLNVTNSNKNTRHGFIFPDNTLHPKMSIKGTGFCSVRKIIESRITVEQQSSKFNVTVTPLPTLVKNERIVRICATFQPQGSFNNSQKLLSVIYDVEMPSGYIFEEIISMSTIPEIKFAKPSLSRSQVQVYFNDFKEGTNYCIDVKAFKVYEIKNIKNASVKVFDNNESDNASIIFYTFTSDDCKSSNEAPNNNTTEINNHNLYEKSTDSARSFNTNHNVVDQN